MGVILDSSLLIAGERRGESVREMLERVEAACGTDADRARRHAFVEELLRTIAVHPLTLDVARLAGRIHGEQMDKGVIIDYADLIIGTTALHLGFDVATLNVRHFRNIPGLRVVTI
jgi:predicted nucleic acid-binding protein